MSNGPLATGSHTTAKKEWKKEKQEGRQLLSSEMIKHLLFSWLRSVWPSLKVTIMSTWCILMSETVTVPSSIMMTSIVSEESRARDTRTQTHTQTHTHGQTGLSMLKFAHKKKRKKEKKERKKDRKPARRTAWLSPHHRHPATGHHRPPGSAGGVCPDQGTWTPTWCSRQGRSWSSAQSAKTHKG